jgi:DNA-binding beta-propeller fold protein YncE
MAIDSNVYVLKGNGTLVRFLSGGQEGFALAPIDPPLTNATGLFTDIDTTSIYIADPTGKRVLVFDKTGSLKSQITAPEFNAPSDISVDEANKRMIVTDGNRLLLVPLP